jgi:hypothetical protein
LAALALVGCNAILGLDAVERRQETSGVGGAAAASSTTASAGGSAQASTGNGGSGGDVVHAGTCSDPIPLAVPSNLQGDNDVGAEDVIDGCMVPIVEAPERVYQVVAPASGKLLVELSSPGNFDLVAQRSCDTPPGRSACCTPNGDPGGCGEPSIDDACVCQFDAYCCGAQWDRYCVAEAALYCGAECNRLGCFSYRDQTYGDYEQMLVPVEEGETYQIVAHGADATDPIGTFDLSVKMAVPCTGTCAAADESCQRVPPNARYCLPDMGACSAASVARDGSQGGTTEADGPKAHVGSCVGYYPGYAHGPEDVWVYTATTTGTLDVNVVPTSNVYLFARDECADRNTERGCSLSGTITFDVETGEDYYIFVDTYTSPGSYTLTITPP